MPIISEKEPQNILCYPNFFGKLEQLDEYASKPRKQPALEGLLRYTPRSEANSENRGRLLVCHDYKGGYTESPSSLAYTFNFWDQCEGFIYFSHQRVSLPPPGWVTAAHRNGVKIFGVLLFEHQESAEDALRLLVGNLPKSRTGPPTTLITGGLPISRHYACLLADLAHERGFDGYLLNLEFSLTGRSDQARAIEAWISILRAELKRKVGDYAQTVWYDSIVTTGDLAWQDRLNSRNISFFLPSDAFFTNYTWPPSFPSFSAQYLLGLDPVLLQGGKKSLRDIYIGIDVWGRGSHGGGGLGCFRAAEHIDPSGLGLSVALFGPAWSWEIDEGTEGRSWDVWWERERTLWVGPETEGAHVEVPDPPLRKGEQPCHDHGEFRPIQEFLDSKPPPKPDLLPFFTSFCPGVGHAWFVEGRKVMFKENGWTDIDKQTSLGNLLWPRPNVRWDESTSEEALPKASTKLTFEDAFNSGSSILINLSSEAGTEEEPAFRCLWIPVQSIALTQGRLYQVELVYKVASSDSVELDIALSAKSETELDIKPMSSRDVENGWSKLAITCAASGSPRTGDDITTIPDSDIMASVGIVVAIASEDASAPYHITVTLGQLSVSPKSPLDNLTPYNTRLLWADCTRSGHVDSQNSEVLTITWDACISYTSPATIRPEDLAPEVPHPPWTLDRSKHWFPCIQYANVYAERNTSSGIRPTAAAQFLGTSGWGSGAITGAGPDRFLLDRRMLPEGLKEGKVRFYVQPVTDRGVVLPWESVHL